MISGRLAVVVVVVVVLAVSCSSRNGIQVDPDDVEFTCCADLGMTEAGALVMTPDLTGPRLESIRLDDGNLVIEAAPDRGLDSATIVRITMTFEPDPKLIAISVMGSEPREPGQKPLSDLVPRSIRLQDWSLEGPIIVAALSGWRSAERWSSSRSSCSGLSQ